MTVKRNLSTLALSLIISGSATLPNLSAAADRYAADQDKTADDFLPAAAGHLIEGIRCNSRQTTCVIVTDREITKAQISIFTRQLCPGARPYITKIGKEWHSRFMCNSVLSQVRFTVLKHVK